MLAATVLVAEDDADILRFVEVNLRLEGFEVVTARDGPDALAKAAAVRPDLVLLDVRMPGIDGYTICARIRGCQPGRGPGDHRDRQLRLGGRPGGSPGWGRRLPGQALPPRRAPRHGQGHAQRERATASPHLPAAWPLGGVVRPRSWRSAVRQPRRGPAGHSPRHSTGRNQIEPLVTGQTRLLT